MRTKYALFRIIIYLRSIFTSISYSYFLGLRWLGEDDIVEKAFTWRFGFDSVELRKLLRFVKNKATVNVSLGVFLYSFVILVVMIGIM